MGRIAKRVCILLGLAAASVTVAAADTVFGPGTYFTLASDGLSYNGTAIPIGGTNPIPVSATLTGNFSPTSGIPVGSGSILTPFSVTLSDLPHLLDGDLVVIDATDAVTSALFPVAVLSWDLIFPGNAGEFDITNLTGPNALPPDFPITTSVSLTDLTLTVNFGGTSSVPEPGAWLLLLTGLTCVMTVRGRPVAGLLKRIFKGATVPYAKSLAVIVCLLAAQFAFGQVKLTSLTTPSTGVAGVTNVNLIGSGFPSGTITPANIVATLAATCDGAAAATSIGNKITKIIGSTERVNISIPGGLATGTYFVTISDSAVGDANFTTQDGSCSELQVTGSAPILNACVATSSMGVLLPSGGGTGNVTAYVPRGYWSGGGTGVFVQNIEGTINPAVNIATPHVPNSCSSNPATGETVCVANNTDVYLITGTTLNTTLSSGSNNSASFSGGSCNNCGVAINAANNTASINMGTVAGPGTSGDGVQILNLSNNTFSPPFETNQRISENISVDPTRSLILSANESGNYMILQLQTDGSLREFDASFTSGLTNDASAEDCSTGIAISPGEFTNSLQMVNLNNITLGATTYSAPNTIATLSTAYSFAAGLSGSAVAQGSGHLAVATGEFGGNTFAVLQLPAVPGTGVPALVDYAVAQIPNSSACGFFSAGFDPHTITAYTSPNNGDAYAVFAGYSGGLPVCLAVVDMTTIINPANAPRGGGGLGSHDIAPANFPASAVTFFPL